MFNTLINRNTNDTREWQKIPWDEPEFSRRMLAEHLNQDHNRASRPLSTIDEHVEWIHHKILDQQPANILDLGCGPGFYSKRFRDLGHRCQGIDFSPASIAYAKEHDLDGNYVLGDIRELDYGDGYDSACLISGELNAFAPKEARAIIKKAYAALKPSGKLLLEVHPYDTIYNIGQTARSWHTAPYGLFGDEPYICLIEHTMVIDCAVSHYYVFSENQETITHYTTMHQGYTDDEYRHMLVEFNQVTFYPSLTGKAERGDLYVIVAEK